MNLIIEKWLHARQTILVDLNELCEHRPFRSLDTDLLQAALQSFCTELVDYLSFWHFQMSETLCNTVEQCALPLVRIPVTLLNALAENTAAALDFSDKHYTTPDFNTLEKDLSKLTEQMAHRLLWEERLVRASALCFSLSQ